MKKNKTIIKRLTAALLCGSLLALSLAGCGKSAAISSAAQSSAASHSADKVVITYVQSPLNVPTIVEKARSSFETAYKAKGVGMEYSNLTSGADQTAALASGKIQLLNNVGGASVIISAAGGADIKILSMYCRAPKAFMLFSKNAAVKSPADLKGKTIAGPKGTTLHEMLAAYLKTGGLTLKDVHFVSMSIPNARAALEGGSVDAALLAGPNAYNCQKKGFHMVTNGDGLITGTSVTATTQKFYNENKDLVNTFLQVQKETLQYISKNYENSMKMTAKATDLDIGAVKEMYKLYDFDSTISDTDIASLQSTEAFLKEAGMISKSVDIKSLLLKR